MHGTKKIKIAIAVIAVLIAIGACVLLFVRKHQQELSMHFEDQNGDDKNLCLITDDMISRYTQDYLVFRHKVFSTGLRASGVEGTYEEDDNEYRKTKIGKLSGIYVSNAYLGNGSTVTYRINSTVKSGNFKIVITDVNNQLLYDVPIDQEAEISFVAEKGMVYYVKFVGESAEIEVELWRSVADESQP